MSTTAERGRAPVPVQEHPISTSFNYQTRATLSAQRPCPGTRTSRTMTVPAAMEQMSYWAARLLSDSLSVLSASKYCLRTLAPRLKRTSELFSSKYNLIQFPCNLSDTLNCSNPGSKKKRPHTQITDTHTHV